MKMETHKKNMKTLKEHIVNDPCAKEKLFDILALLDCNMMWLTTVDKRHRWRVDFTKRRVIANSIASTVFTLYKNKERHFTIIGFLENSKQFLLQIQAYPSGAIVAKGKTGPKALPYTTNVTFDKIVLSTKIIMEL